MRYESPSQQTARLAPNDVMLGDKLIRKRQAVIAVMGAANRDPERFPDPDRLDLGRQDNRHVAFAWASHFCFGAPLARIEGQTAFEAIVRRMPHMKLEPGPLKWRENLGSARLNFFASNFLVCSSLEASDQGEKDASGIIYEYPPPHGRKCMKSDTSQLSEAKRILVEKYLRGDLTQTAMDISVNTRNAEAELDSPRERVVMIQPGEGSKRPFFFLHGHWKGTAFFCFPLAHELGLGATILHARALPVRWLEVRTSTRDNGKSPH